MLPMKLLNIEPTSVSLEVSTKCPLNCIYCSRKGKGENIEYESYTEILKNISNGGKKKNVVFCGIGESFMNPKFYDMASDNMIKGISIISSGMLPIDFNKLYESSKVNLIIFSIDAVTEEAIKMTCGENYKYDVLEINLKNMSEYSRKNRKVMTLINCTVNKYNYNTLPKIMEFAYKHNFKIVHFSLPWGQEEFIKENYHEIKSGIDEARKMAAKWGIITDDPFHSYCCIQYDSILPFINLKGELFPCGFALNQNYSVGNLFDHSFKEIWDNEKYKKFKNGSLCKECYMIRMGDIQREMCRYE